jgi:hypothetical protein
MKSLNRRSLRGQRSLLLNNTLYEVLKQAKPMKSLNSLRLRGQRNLLSNNNPCEVFKQAKPAKSLNSLRLQAKAEAEKISVFCIFFVA